MAWRVYDGFVTILAKILKWVLILAAVLIVLGYFLGGIALWKLAM